MNATLSDHSWYIAGMLVLLSFSISDVNFSPHILKRNFGYVISAVAQIVSQAHFCTGKA